MCGIMCVCVCQLPMRACVCVCVCACQLPMRACACVCVYHAASDFFPARHNSLWRPCKGNALQAKLLRFISCRSLFETIKIVLFLHIIRMAARVPYRYFYETLVKLASEHAFLARSLIPNHRVHLCVYYSHELYALSRHIVYRREKEHIDAKQCKEKHDWPEDCRPESEALIRGVNQL